MLPRDKLEAIAARHRELEELLCRPEVLSDAPRYQAYAKERSDLGELAEAFARYREVERQTEENREALADPELRELAEAELETLAEEHAALEARLQLLLLPKDPAEERNTILEIRGGAGGEEAALFASDLFRMYGRYAERRGWRVEMLSSSPSSAGGLKEVIALVQGDHVYARLKFEGGVHRVQRVPATEAQGRVHTSTATVAVLPEAEEVDVEIRDEDLEVNIAAAGGPGGQGVNTTNSAVQIQHKPSGIIVKCQDERSQIKNKARAMQVLRARLLERERQERHAAESAERRGMVGSGDRAEKIRTYNYPQNRVTDHRIQLTLHKLDAILDGDLDELFDALRTTERAELLRAQGTG